ncbi:hypothetical protein [Polyangium aurulentum]|uniref:hypothetical protein n=1 Tax=Polyangium aurulentum TaxID=2567896 RepID=UPI00146B7AAB|nr:hypothetical protein [Polyangium aurulentum]UQA63180.1 hypothetical protein E8A73_023030 [Polyangium aurulentum]
MKDTTKAEIADSAPLQAQGPLATLARSPEVSVVRYDKQLDGVEGRIVFRSWTREIPPAATLHADALPEERTRWFRALLSKLAIVDRCFVAVGAGRDWVEARLSEEGRDGRWIDPLLDAQRGTFIDVFVLGQDRDSALRVWRNKGQLVAHVFHGLRAKYEARALANAQSHEEARTKHWNALRQTLAAVSLLSWSEETAPEDRMPSPEILHQEVRRGELPIVRKLRDTDRSALLQWLERMFRVRAGRGSVWLHAGFDRWWRVNVPDVGPLFPAIFENRSTADVIMLSADRRCAFGWLVEENHVAAFDYGVEMLLDRRESRQRLEALLDRVGFLRREDVQGIGSQERVEQIFRRRFQVSTLNRSVSSAERDHWLTACIRDRLSPRPADSPDGVGRVELSLGKVGLIPWTSVRYQNDDWLAALWRTGEIQQLCIRTVYNRRILGIRTTTKTHEAFLYRSEPRQRHT